MSNIQKVITANGTEHLTVRMQGENMALVYEDRSRRHLPYRIILTQPREYWELHDFIEAHGAQRPNYVDYVKSVFCQANEEPKPWKYERQDAVAKATEGLTTEELKQVTPGLIRRALRQEHIERAIGD